MTNKQKWKRRAEIKAMMLDYGLIGLPSVSGTFLNKAADLPTDAKYKLSNFD